MMVPSPTLAAIVVPGIVGFDLYDAVTARNPANVWYAMLYDRRCFRAWRGRRSVGQWVQPFGRRPAVPRPPVDAPTVIVAMPM